mmetsp:Transcript_18587/g.51879  ORF Transcript_18587/g.51879 Transcript_18587/m.51879 type:complete len:539 (-) Transcript_18587:1657-3273(-)
MPIQMRRPDLMRAAISKPALATIRCFSERRVLCFKLTTQSSCGATRSTNFWMRSLSSLSTTKKAATSYSFRSHGTTKIPTIVNNHENSHVFHGPRYFSSRSNNNSTKSKRFHLRAIPFSISPEEALQSFQKWAEEDQGLRYLMNYKTVEIGAAFVPVWTFDLNIRFKQQHQKGTRSSSSSSPYSWKPPIFEAYDQAGSKNQQDVIYLPGGLAAYAGYAYRRSLINPVHSSTLIFMGDRTEPFGGWMLKDMILKETGNPIHVIPDAWNSTKGKAFSVVKEELQGIVDADWMESELTVGGIPPPIVQTEVVAARRVFMPTFVIKYNIFGLEYQAFVSGCDTSAPVGGVSHQIFESNETSGGLSHEIYRSSRNLLMRLSRGAYELVAFLGQKHIIPFHYHIGAFLSPWLKTVFSFSWFILLRLWAASPVVGVVGGLFAGFRKVLQPWMDNKEANADWERQRQREAEMTEGEDDASNKYNMNDFHDITGRARKFFNQNRNTILRSLSGDVKHEEGDFDWYADWAGTLEMPKHMDRDYPSDQD